VQLLDSSERLFLTAVSDLGHCNPFLPERIDFERKALGSDYEETEPVWSLRGDFDIDRENVRRLAGRVEQLVGELHGRLLAGATADEPDLNLYKDLVLYSLYERYRGLFHEAIQAAGGTQKGSPRVPYWKQFLAEYNRLLVIPGRSLPTSYDPAHMFACFFQLRRAFGHIFQFIVGGSMPAARLRAAVWQSVFTHDMRRYRRSLYKRMGDVTTLVTGPSGTGKELVARAVALSRYIPFDPQTERFTADFAGVFHPLNLSALSPTLIESELFGHCRGAFTGAVSDRAGWLEVCEPLGTVFLDEIGELDAGIAVKLLRVLQTRTFQRLGETEDRQFAGKIIAATNRDLVSEMRAGRFRRDLYYRLCSDIIVTPSLREQLADSPEELKYLILFACQRIAGEEAESLAGEVEGCIAEHLGPDYDWPGNFRELEQCVRNVMIRGRYEPPRMIDETVDPRAAISAAVQAGRLTADELLSHYCTLVYAQTGSYEQAAQRLKLDRRTVKAKLDRELLARLKGH
jgi:transcriptional regulator with AAA-type ATPase domain